MNKIFEQQFSEIQADMVSICLENVESRANIIYIYCSFESSIVSSDYFYNINNKFVRKHKLNESLTESEKKYDVSSERQKGVLRILNQDIKQMLRLCKEHKREMPTEIKLMYDVQKNSLNAEYKYELVYSNDPVKTADDIAIEWFEELKVEKN